LEILLQQIYKVILNIKQLLEPVHNYNWCNLLFFMDMIKPQIFKF